MSHEIQISEWIAYDASTGRLTRKRARYASQVGSNATWLNKYNGYLYVDVKFNGKTLRHLAHRLAWFLQTGTWPQFEIDHINGVRTDNRFENLRQATRMNNAKNLKRPKSNTTGFKGVTTDKRRPGFIAQISRNGRNTRIGTFPTLEAAKAAYDAAAQEQFGEFVRREADGG
jgi:hypothetical protein